MSKLSSFFSEFKYIFKLLNPNSKAEILLFLFFIILYYPLGIYLSLDTCIIDKKDFYDLYFSFDNNAFMFAGSHDYETHPLSFVFFLPMRFIYLTLDFFSFNHKIYILFSTFFCSLFVSYSNLFVFKYLKNIIKLNVKYCYSIILFYAFFSGNIILSFTADSFTFSLFLLSMNIYIASYFIANKKILSYGYYIIIGTFIGGQTITNLPKAIEPILFEKKFTHKNYPYFIKKTCLITFILSLIILIPFKFNLYFFILQNIDRKNVFKMENFSIFDSFTSYFFGGNMLLPSLKIDNSPWKWIPNQGIYLNFYDSIFQYLFVFSVLGLILYAIFKNFKNKLFWILLLSWGIDIFILIVFKLNLSDSFMYGGHFIFVIPLLIGWLFYKLKNSFQKILNYFLILLILILIINNGFRIFQFIQLVENLCSNL
ncbi:DUF6080 domain-containing protein [Apibacter adventoris]|uniref:Glycosyltransferase RgtA/B/C/D-like domain-containing protein n=1 Tax=Apibacter adventoris TaxID=1679466 RepID=A0A2S8A8Y4_9FLAO|nr:DUF6080 domain-containing protein [Apibacter adventoris]PQL91028.1 hypothetical protein C4S77_09230 [Apibacter adventoris]